MAVFQTPAGSPLLGRMDAVRQANTPQAVTSTTARGQPFGPEGLEDPRFPEVGKREGDGYVMSAFVPQEDPRIRNRIVDLITPSSNLNRAGRTDWRGTDALNDALEIIYNDYPGLRDYAFQVLDSRQNPDRGRDRVGKIEFISSEEPLEYRPPGARPGREVIELYPGLQDTTDLPSAIFGDMLHYAATANPDFRELREKFSEARTDKQRAIDREAYEYVTTGRQEGAPDIPESQRETRSFDKWMKHSRLDAWIRARLAPDPESDWSMMPYSKEQEGLLLQMKGALKAPLKGTLSKARIQDLVRETSDRFSNVPYDLALSLLEQESSYRQNIVSKVKRDGKWVDGAVGLMQLMPGTAEAYGVTDSKDPKQNIRGGVHYLSDLIKRYDGNVELAIAAYNAGPRAVANADYQIPDIEETRLHVDDVMTGASRIRVNETNQGIWERNRLNREARERGEPGRPEPITPATNMDRYYQRNPDLAPPGWTGERGPSLTQQLEEDWEARNPTPTPILDSLKTTALIAGSAYGGGRLATGAYGAARGLAAPVVRSAAGRLGNMLTGTGAAVDQGRREFTNRMGQIILGTSLAAQPLSQMAQRVASSPAAQNVALKGKELAGKFGEVNKMANALRRQWDATQLGRGVFDQLEGAWGMGLRVMERGKLEKDYTAVLRSVGDTLEVVATKSRPMTEAMFQKLVQLPNGPERQKIVEMLDDASYRIIRQAIKIYGGGKDQISRAAVHGTTVGREFLRNLSKGGSGIWNPDTGMWGLTKFGVDAFRRLPQHTQKRILEQGNILRFGGRLGRGLRRGGKNLEELGPGGPGS